MKVFLIILFFFFNNKNLLFKTRKLSLDEFEKNNIWNNVKNYGILPKDFTLEILNRNVFINQIFLFKAKDKSKTCKSYNDSNIKKFKFTDTNKIKEIFDKLHNQRNNIQQKDYDKLKIKEEYTIPYSGDINWVTIVLIPNKAYLCKV